MFDGHYLIANRLPLFSQGQVHEMLRQEPPITTRCSGRRCVHPEHEEVLPLAPEPILMSCELQQSLVDDLPGAPEGDHCRTRWPNGPHITHLKNKGFRLHSRSQTR